MIFFFTIIAGISILSAYQLNSLSKKTDAILKDNNFSIIMARDMAEGLTILNQEIIRYSFNNIYPDATIIANTKAKFEKSIQLRKTTLPKRVKINLLPKLKSGFKEYLKNINTLIWIDTCRKSQLYADTIPLLVPTNHASSANERAGYRSKVRMMPKIQQEKD